MSAELNEVALQAGKDMERNALIGAAYQVSDWLVRAPYSRDRLPDEILGDAVAGEAYFMTSVGQTLGYFALQPFDEPVYGTIAGGPVRTLWRMPHFGVRSLVVSPDARGNRYGDRLIAGACNMAGSLTIDAAPGESFSLVSAVSTIGSDAMKVFGRQGFSIEGGSSVANEHKYTPEMLNEAGKTVVSKVVQVGRRQPVLTGRLLS